MKSDSYLEYAVTAETTVAFTSVFSHVTFGLLLYNSIVYQCLLLSVHCYQI